MYFLALCVSWAMAASQPQFGQGLAPPNGGGPPFLRPPGLIGPNGPFSIPKPEVALNGRCSSDGDCKAAYAMCDNGKCSCRSGFEPSGEKCEVKVVVCPYGDSSKKECTMTQTCDGRPCADNPFPPAPSPLLAPEPAGRKKRQFGGGGFQPPPPFPRPPQIKWVDTCDAGEYCVLHSPAMGPMKDLEGHCCKKPMAGCPVGEPLKDVSCGPWSNGFCPPSHHCSVLQDGTSPKPISARCCPKACPDTAIYKDGQCYSIQLAGEECEVDEQCGRSNAKCVQGKCQCPKLTKAQNGVCVKVFCQGGPRLLSPETNTNGDLVECSSKSDCSSNSYCAKDHRICCPTPDPYCPPIAISPVAAPPKVQSCDITEREGNDCGENSFCFQYFYSTEPGTGTVCCQQPVIPPQVGISNRISNGPFPQPQVEG